MRIYICSIIIIDNNQDSNIDKKTDIATIFPKKKNNFQLIRKFYPISFALIFTNAFDHDIMKNGDDLKKKKMEERDNNEDKNINDYFIKTNQQKKSLKK